MLSTARARRSVATFALLAVGLVGGGLALGLAPAAALPAAGAATCTSAGGVSVVVDFRELGGSAIAACAENGGGQSAAAIFESVGVKVDYAQRQPGFVCRVAGQPATSPCVNTSPADAYWGLWWADGTSGSWTYSSSGVGGLIVPAGGSVGWAWQQDRQSIGAVPPGTAAPVAPAATPTPTPTPTPTSSPTSAPSPATPSPTGGTFGGDGGRGGGKGGKNGSPSPSPTQSPTPSATPSATPPESALPSESPSDSPSKDGSKKGSEDPAVEVESPGDSTPSEDLDPSASGSESPGDSSASGAAEAGTPGADEPARVPAALTWSIVGLLAIAIASSAVVARRRRGV